MQVFYNCLMAYVAELICYPVKSCAGTGLETATFTEQGIAFDREWMVADENGKFMSQRQNPELALIVPKLADGFLRVVAPGMEELAVDLADLDHETVASTVWGNNAPAITQGFEADGWFSEYLEQNVQLVRKDPDASRSVKPVYQLADATNKVAFADGASSLLTTMPSLAALNERLERPIPMNRFRPNIVVDGEDVPAFDEDYWRGLKVGMLSGVVAWACARCTIPETDQTTGVREKQVLKALQGFRKGVDAVDPTNKGVFFGQNFLHTLVDGNVVNVGDTVQVTERSSERNILGLPEQAF
jgi:uncharacterized protein